VPGGWQSAPGAEMRGVSLDPPTLTDGAPGQQQLARTEKSEQKTSLRYFLSSV